MICPNCGGETKTLESRQYSHVYKRRHECLICKERFSTYEIEVTEYKRLKKIEEVFGAFRACILDERS